MLMKLMRWMLHPAHWEHMHLYASVSALQSVVVSLNQNAPDATIYARELQSSRCCRSQLSQLFESSLTAKIHKEKSAPLGMMRGASVISSSRGSKPVETKR